MDLTKTIEPDSTQINADDLIGGPATVTITEVKKGSAEQPVDIIVAEFPGRAYRPSKSMRRVIVAAWGTDSKTYIGRRLTLYRDPDITFGRDRVGGIRISALSDIDKPLTLALTVSRGKRQQVTVDPLPPAEKQVVWAGLTDAMKATGADQQAVLTLAAQVTGGPVTSLHGLTQDQVDRLTALVAQTAVTIKKSESSTKENEND